MKMSEFNDLSDHIHKWAQGKGAPGEEVIAAILLMSAQNAVQHRISRRDFLDKGSQAYEMALQTVQTDNPLLYGSDGKPL